MFEPLIASITSYASLSDKEIKAFTSRMTLQKVCQGDLLLDIGEVCMSWGFIIKGSFKAYYLNQNLDEVITNLFSEHTWVLNHTSFTAQKSSKSKIEAFEDSEVLMIDIHALHELIGESQKFFALGKILEVDPKKPPETANPEEKYLHLMDQNPAIIRTFPLKHIASYLGMTPETLSRVRKKIS